MPQNYDHSWNECEESSICPQHRTVPRNEPTFFMRGGKKYLVPPASHRCTREEVEYHGSCEWADRAQDEGWGFAEEAPKKPEKSISRNITVYYATSDRYRETRKFKTLSGARAYAQKKIGKTPEMGTHYAVSGYGTAKIEVSGASLKELFPET
jgi:hypothetical protein